ncbi:DNA gyrase subunit A [bacterium]|nr:DNA gyrase subunit A [bacterium]MBU1917752.1 DNA gyrase subunit A [bacterium]
MEQTTDQKEISKDIIGVNLEDEMRNSYLDYSMSVIIGRALPDIRDGLKPVHRRILYAMFKEGHLASKRYSKCAGVVGEVLKKYHPHGDSAVYDALVRMAQPWNMRYPLIDGQGNFGSVDGDSAAAYRYTECRLTKLAETLMADIEKSTVDYSPNFDDSVFEPVVLPTRVPNLLINGSDGIAVGMATKIPPHNLTEVTNALITLVDEPNVSIDEIMKIIPGPDFPTAGYIYGTSGIKSAYRTGRGKVTMRAKLDIEPYGKNKDREAIVVTEIPYQANKARILENIANLTNDGRIDGISDLRDESDRTGMRMVIELKKNANANVILNQLYKHTALQASFGVIMLSISNGRPVVTNLKAMLEEFIKHRKEVVLRRTAHELAEAEHKAHILEGLKIAVDNIDEVIALIKKSTNPSEAKIALRQNFELSDIQAQAILDMRLHRLTGLERDKIKQDYEELLTLITKLRKILASNVLVMNIIKDELIEIRDKFGDARRTEIVHTELDNIDIEDLIQKEEMVVTVSHLGYIKRHPVSTYRTQRRGGRGKQGMTTREEDFVEKIFTASTHDTLLVFTNLGRVHWLKVYEVPEVSRTAKGKSISNLIQLASNEKIAAILPVEEYNDNEHIIFTTQKGTVKKTPLSAYSNPRAGGIIAITLKADELISVRLVSKGQDIIISSSKGQAIRFDESQIRPMGRSAAGVRGINLKADDIVVGMDVVEPGKTILTISERGYGKRTHLDEYRKQSRGGSGILTLKVTDKNGKVVTATEVSEEDHLMLISNGGKIIRQEVKKISVMGRNTQGVRLIVLDPDETVVSATIIEPDETIDNATSIEPAEAVVNATKEDPDETIVNTTEEETEEE